MPTLLSHPALPLAIGLGLGRDLIPPRLLWTGAALSILPDLDVLAFRLGIPYTHAMGHRGFSHSLTFALLVALIGVSAHRRLTARPGVILGFLFAATASHGLLDSLTNGGEGIALLWPFNGERLFAPVQVIEVAPLGLERFLSLRGVEVLWSEFRWVWIPALLLGGVIAGARRHLRPLPPLGGVPVTPGQPLPMGQTPPPPGEIGSSH